MVNGDLINMLAIGSTGEQFMPECYHRSYTVCRRLLVLIGMAKRRHALFLS
jgi:hypothetical protein